MSQVIFNRDEQAHQLIGGMFLLLLLLVGVIKPHPKLLLRNTRLGLI